MSVYIVLCGNLDDTEVVSVHLTAEGAEKAADTHRRRFHGGAWVEQYEVHQ